MPQRTVSIKGPGLESQIENPLYKVNKKETTKKKHFLSLKYYWLQWRHYVISVRP